MTGIDNNQQKSPLKKRSSLPKKRGGVAGQCQNGLVYQMSNRHATPLSELGGRSFRPLFGSGVSFAGRGR